MSTNLAILNYGCGNVTSIFNMIKHVGGEAHIASNHEDIKNVKGIIIPGVGSFDNGITKLKQNNLFNILNEKALDEEVLIFGICLGMQLMFESSEEGQLKGFGWINGSVKNMKNQKALKDLKVPHMGWNNLEVNIKNKIFKNINNESRFYFTHSYYCDCFEEEDILAKTYYGYKFTSSVKKNNIYGFQFHPEKSHKFGKIIFENLINLVQTHVK